MRSNPALNSFYFPTRKYFTILFKFLDFLRSLDRFTVLIKFLICEFYMTWKKISLKYLLIGGVDVCPLHVQTVSTWLMSKLVKSKCVNFEVLESRIIFCFLIFLIKTSANLNEMHADSLGVDIFIQESTFSNKMIAWVQNSKWIKVWFRILNKSFAKV